MSEMNAMNNTPDTPDTSNTPDAPDTSDFDLDKALAAFLGTCRTASLATVDAADHPHAANVQYAHDAALRLYFVSSPESAHSLHIARRPAVAVTIYASVDAPGDIHGLQLHGRCHSVVGAAERQTAWTLYADKYPFVATDPALRRRVEAECFYCVTPTWLRWIDNRRGFGFKVERQFEAQ